MKLVQGCNNMSQQMCGSCQLNTWLWCIAQGAGTGCLRTACWFCEKGKISGNFHPLWAQPIFEAIQACTSYLILSHSLCVFTDGYAYQVVEILVCTQGKGDMLSGFAANICLFTYSQGFAPLSKPYKMSLILERLCAESNILLLSIPGWDDDLLSSHSPLPSGHSASSAEVLPLETLNISETHSTLLSHSGAYGSSNCHPPRNSGE
jgi:hypothetical protein